MDSGIEPARVTLVLGNHEVRRYDLVAGTFAAAGMV